MFSRFQGRKRVEFVRERVLTVRASSPPPFQNWSRAYRWYLTAVGGILVLNATFASSAPSGVIPQMEVYFGFGRELATLLIAIFVGGSSPSPPLHLVV